MKILCLSIAADSYRNNSYCLRIADSRELLILFMIKKLILMTITCVFTGITRTFTFVDQNQIASYNMLTN